MFKIIYHAIFMTVLGCMLNLRFAIQIFYILILLDYLI